MKWRTLGQQARNGDFQKACSSGGTAVEESDLQREDTRKVGPHGAI